MRPARPFFRYRRDLKVRARHLRRDPTPAERKLWFEFLSTHFEKFTRQKPLGRYVADFYCARHSQDGRARHVAHRRHSIHQLGGSAAVRGGVREN
jgi:very-short-patch-repair endonuclease